MKYGIFGDIHSNFDAFSSVISDMKKQGITKFYCIGDIVGYGAEPTICIETILELNCLTVAGNHDYAVVGKISHDNFNPDAKESVYWTKDSIFESDKDFLNNLPLVLHNKLFTLVHGTLHFPLNFSYMINNDMAIQTFKLLKTNLCFVGHTHIPFSFLLKDNKLYYNYNNEIDLNQWDKAIINTGSVGQPRDKDPRSSYILYDSKINKIFYKRVEYDVNSAKNKIYNANLPSFNADRLSIEL